MKTLVIVESPTKAKTISKFIGKDFIVESSFGHLRDLPKSKMGIDIAGGTFEPEYVIPKDKSAQVKKLKTLADKSDEIIFATDEDREGEAISWHLAKIFEIDPEDAKRIAFHEITKEAVEMALENPRPIDLKLVDAQQARRVLDRLVGYELSPFLWKKVAKGLSAGRVQSVAVRLVVEREREIKNFLSQEYWYLEGVFEKEQQFKGKLFAIDNKKLDKLDIKNKEQIDKILSELQGSEYLISEVEKKETLRTPPAPFITSVLQQYANNRLGYSAKQTMMLAQQLYEGVELGSEGHVGLITYMRTDSTNLAEKFITEAADFIKNNFGENYTNPAPRKYKTKSKGAQEAHEAIRPTDPKRTPESVKEFLSPQQYKLYEIIWKRAVATQMIGARINHTNINIQSGKYLFRTVGETMIFPGWLTLYPENIKNEMLPELQKGEKIKCLELLPEQKFTEPPARYSDATLVKALEEYGIGRPSTYAPTIATIEERKYVERDENKRLKPNDIAFVVNDLLVQHFSQIVDYQFTAQMEKNLDEIAEGIKDWQPIIATFYHPFHENLVNKTSELDKKDTAGMRELGNDPITGEKIFVRVGRFGPYAQKGEGIKGGEKPKFASLTKTQSIESITLEEALKLFTLPRTLGVSKDGEEIISNIGRFGPYVKIGKKFVSIKSQDPYTITLEEALKAIEENEKNKAKKELKLFPGSDIQILNGQYGPYITDGKKNVKIPEDKTPDTLTLAECEELIKNAPAKRKRFFRKKKS